MSASGSDSSVELSDDEYADLLGSDPWPLVVIKQEVLDVVDEEMTTETVEGEKMQLLHGLKRLRLLLQRDRHRLRRVRQGFPST